MKKKKDKQCEWCGADLILQPGGGNTEDGRAFCTPTCAATYRVTQEPIHKQYNGG